MSHKLLAVMTLTLVSPCICIAQEPTLQDVQQGYAATMDALLPLWTRCAWSQGPTDARLAEGPDALPEMNDVHVEWAVDGEKWHFSHRSEEQRRWLSYDGTSLWELAFDESNWDTVLALKKYSLKTRSDFVLRVGPTPGKWLGLYFAINDERQSGATLRQMLESDGARLLGVHEIDEHRCVRVELAFPTPAGDELPVSVWFDPAAGYLPRRIETRFSRTNPDPDILVVERFRKIATGGGRPSFFPESMVRDSDGFESRVAVVEVKAGGNPDSSLFRPRPANQTQTFDMESRQRQRDLRAYLSQNQTPEPSPAADRMRPPTQLPAQIVPAVPAYPNSNWTWPQVLMVIGIVLLAGGTWHVFRR